MALSSRRNATRRLLLCVITSMSLPSTLSSQSMQSGSRTNVVFTGRDLRILGGAMLGTAAVSLFDVRIARAFADSGLHTRRGLQSVAKGTSRVTETILMISGGSAWAIARLGHSDGAADVALHTFESVASGAAAIQVVRGVVGRARPYVVDGVDDVHDSDPY
jgi:hypothetical protein